MSDERTAEEVVALALISVTGDGEDPATTWEALDAEAREQFLICARVAMEAHTTWLQDNGFRIAPPGTMLRPKSDNDARAMIMAAQEWLKQPEHAAARRKGLLKTPKLIMPRGH